MSPTAGTRILLSAHFLIAFALLLGRIEVLHGQTPVDYQTQIQPIFDASCGGGFCHLNLSETSDVELSSYASTMESFGQQYQQLIVVPFDAEASPLWEKIASDTPIFGDRMPRDAPALSQAEQDIIARWINEGAREAAVTHRRGDVDRGGSVNITDAIKILHFLFLGGEEPYCSAVANANADSSINLTDSVYILDYLFKGGPALPELTPAEQISCNPVNHAPEVDPLGTITGREGQLLEFEVIARDPDGDSLTYTAIGAPSGFSIDAATGFCRWTPGFNQAGDHRLRIRVTDAGVPELTAETTGLIRIIEGNRPPVIGDLDRVFGRELVPMSFVIEASDAEGDELTFEIIEAPTDSMLEAATGEFQWLPPSGQTGEHVLRFQVTDSGEPPQSAIGEITLVILAQDSPINQPPSLPRREVYRTYTGSEIRLPINANDPDGDTLTYTMEDLPEGAQFDETRGLLTWTPAASQTGVFYLPFTVNDSGLPPASVEGILVFRIVPVDACVEPNCDPATGCAPTLIDIGESCCTGEPELRVPEPVADCPAGRVLYFGRNTRGFGRLQNCDRLQLILFPQGGANISLNLEARCIDTSAPALMRIALATATRQLFDEELDISFQIRNDGFAQNLGLFFIVNPFISVLDLEGQEAILAATLIDTAGNVVEQEIRVVLTLQNVEELPNPDVEDIPAGEVGCIGCHRPLTPNGEREGIEDAHPWHPLTCTDCHGGNPDGVTRGESHVQPGDGPDFIRNLAADQLDDIDTDYLQFINPGDSRVASRGCGSQSPAANGGGCHQGIVDSVPLSVMSTYTGHYTLPRFLAGSQDRNTIYGVVDIADPDYDADTAPKGTVGSIEALREPSPEADRASLGTCIDVYLPKSCPTCHLSDFGRNNAPGNYRSSGCTACHMVYADDGLSRSRDPAIDKDFPPHPIVHELTKAIPTEQCSHCHFQGGRIGLSYRGIREGGFPPDKTPEHGVTLGKPLHAHDRDYYFIDEDNTNDIDETPPDLHFAAGMDCIDCHIGRDVHGDGNLYTSERHQVGIGCEDCHGTVRAEITEDEKDGQFKNSGGAPMRHLRRTEDNRIMLQPHHGGEELEVAQIHRILSSGINHAMSEAMGVNDNGFSHADTMECYTCHTSWRLTCMGCHVTVDDSLLGTNRTTGEDSQGAISVTRDDYSIDFFALGLNHRGKITPLCNSMSVFMSYRDEDGVERFRDRVRTSHDGKKGFGWNPFHHHTVSRIPQNCDRCHPVAAEEGPDNAAVLRETYGFGNGKYTIVDGDGVLHDLTAFLDDDGELISSFPHPDTGPVPTAIRERALSNTVVPHPRN